MFAAVIARHFARNSCRGTTVGVSLSTAAIRWQQSCGLRRWSQGRSWYSTTSEHEEEQQSFAGKIRSSMRDIPSAIAVVTSGNVKQQKEPYHKDALAANSGEQTQNLESNQEKGSGGLSHMIDEHPGLLVSTFNIVTLEPIPYVSFNIKIPSSTWDAIEGTKKFEVHFPLSENVAQHYGLVPLGKKNNSDALYRELCADRLFALSCELDSYHKVGDHLVVIGKVTGLHEAPVREDERSALLWMRGAWHKAI